MEKINLTGMDMQELEAFAEAQGEKAFRGRQLFGWIYKRRAASFDEMTNLAKAWRAKLDDMAQLGHLELVEKKESVSGTVKYLFCLADGHHIESVFIPDNGRRTLCISSQVGCALNCDFCATGRMGFKRSLSHGEIVDQVLYVSRDQNTDLTNIVFMGMGEPFMNYDNVIKAANVIKHSDGIAVGARHIVISTAGVVDKIYRYADEKQPFLLAISLNSPFDEQRKAIMPVGKRWDLAELFKGVRYYSKNAKHLLTYEYVLFAGVNDSREHALALKKLVSPINCKLNLIPYNATLDLYKRPSDEQLDKFVKWLSPIHIPITVRRSKGDDINAACGQLAGQARKEAV